jgi:hypothetical protein
MPATTCAVMSAWTSSTPVAPRRTQDLEDIKALIAANRQALKMDEVREYFRLFNREALLEEILK